MQTAIRIRPDTREVFARARRGKVEAGDHACGAGKHHETNLVTQGTLAEAVQARGDALHPRMRGQRSGQPTISPSDAVLIEVEP